MKGQVLFKGETITKMKKWGFFSRTTELEELIFT
jgi:hypothetical protein